MYCNETYIINTSFEKTILHLIIFTVFVVEIITGIKWRPPRLSELTPIISNMELTHLGLEASIVNILA